MCDVYNIMASQFLKLLLPMILSSPHSATHFQVETLDLVITNCSASSSISDISSVITAFSF